MMIPVDEEFAGDAAVMVAEKKTVEFVIEKEGFFVYNTVHRIVHINNDKGIEYFNKVYLPYTRGLDVVDVKARTLLPDGKVMVFDEKNIKEITEDDNVYKIFALDGLTRGCQIEYYYTVKKYASLFGREVMLGRFSVMNGEFQLIAPPHLRFEVKSFNGLPNATEKLVGEKRVISVSSGKMKSGEEEKYSKPDANSKRVEYKLSYNTSNNERQRLFTWNELSKKVFESFGSFNDKEKKKLKELLEDAGVSDKMNTEEKIIRIESYIKKNFMYRDDISDDDADDLVGVIKSKLCSERAINKLFSTSMTVAGIDHHIVLTGDREDFSIDPKFENWNNADNVLLYFPQTNKYLAPTASIFRYPWIPPTWAGGNGVFCVTTTIGTLTTAIAEVKPIPFEAYEHSFLNMNMKVKMDEKQEALVIDVKQLYGGYSAPNYKAPFVFYPPDEQKNFLKELIKFGTNSENILTSGFENKELDQKDPYSPFVISATVKSTQLIEHAGDKIIFKVGELIGQQVEMYETGERVADMDLDYPHALVRTIEFQIPESYEIKNLKDLDMGHVYKENGELTMGFVSSYTLSGNLLKILIKEDYVRVHYPLSQYADFKKVINAAADFNKVALVLQKK